MREKEREIAERERAERAKGEGERRADRARESVRKEGAYIWRQETEKKEGPTLNLFYNFYLRIFPSVKIIFFLII